MSHIPMEPVRLADLPPERDTVGVSPLVRAAAAPLPDLTLTARQRIRGRLYGSLYGHDRAQPRRVRLALVLAFTLALGGVVGAATHSVIIRRLSVRDRATPARAPNGAYVLSRRPALTTPGMSTAVDHQVALPEVVLPAPRVVPPLEMPRAKTPDLRAPATVATSRIALAEPLAPRPASVSPPPAPRPSPPTEDSVLADAIRKLRVDGDAAAALTLLNDQQSSLSASAFRPEASAVRIEALLKLGRTHAALSALDRLPLDSMPRRDEWQVVRGELRATAGRWQEAEADFAAVLTSRSSDARGNLTERALWGRVVTRSRRGDVAGARSDCREYLRRFPEGRFADQASQALLSLSPR